MDYHHEDHEDRLNCDDALTADYVYDLAVDKLRDELTWRRIDIEGMSEDDMRERLLDNLRCEL